MNRYVAIGEASVALGVSITTLRRWEAEGKLIPERTAGRQRRYDLAKLKPELFLGAPQGRKTIAYARVSSHDQKDDLERQKQVLESYCAQQGWTFEVIADLGSGMNYNKKGLKRLLNEIIEGRLGRLVVAHKDRLLRFGAELVFASMRSERRGGAHHQQRRGHDLRGRPGEGRAGDRHGILGATLRQP